MCCQNNCHESKNLSNPQEKESKIKAVNGDTNVTITEYTILKRIES